MSMALSETKRGRPRVLSDAERYARKIAYMRQWRQEQKRRVWAEIREHLFIRTQGVNR